jgi:hypothetical protein
MRKSILFILLLLYISIIFSQTPVFDQSITINQTFTTDTEIYPFNGETLYGAGVNGSISFYSDSSLVRIIISDNYDLEYMIYETYTMLDTTWNFSFNQECDETCFLDGFVATSIIVNVINASVTLNQLKWSNTPSENIYQLQQQAKKNKDLEKIDKLNDCILRNNMLWKAGQTPLSELFYFEKKFLFGQSYNPQGFEFYKGGIYYRFSNMATMVPTPDSNVVMYFDWRTRHGANNSLSPYWDGDPDANETGNGWMTSVKHQNIYGNCGGTCYIFGPIGSIESVINLYLNQHIDANLSEQHVLNCKPGSCNGGNSNGTLNFFTTTGIFDENSYPWTGDSVACDTTVIPNYHYKGTGIIGINNSNYEQIKKSIIEHGPLKATSYTWFAGQNSIETAHAITLLGFGQINEGDTIHVNTGMEPDIIVEAGNPFIGATYWICKNSYGPNFGDDGYVRISTHQSPTYTEYLGNVKAQVLPIQELVHGIDTIPCLDYDNDGYYNWGIGPKPATCDTCPNEPDGDDFDPSLGPYDSRYNCTLLCENFTYSSIPEIISNIEHKYDIEYVNHDIIIKNGGELVVTGELWMIDNAKIIVERGGKLKIDAGLLTNACSGPWQGIELRGQYNQPQSYTYQGAVEIINGGTIENAEIGIQTIKMSDIPPPGEATPDYTYTGGMVLCDGAVFKNNNIAVKFWPYDYSSSASLFRYCQFISNDDMIEGTNPENFIEMSDISGIVVGGCSFNDSREGLSYSELSTGIDAYDSEFKVWSLGGASVFTGLYYGIKTHALNPTETVEITNSDFIDNFRGIYISGIETPVVVGNDFSINSPFSQFNGGYGLYLDHCSGYKVEENNFFHEGGSQTGVGLVVNESGKEPNQVYRNWFTNLECGMDIQGENRDKDGTGLELKCNQYENTKMDKIITWEGPFVTPYSGIASNQGSSSSSPEDMAGNLFHIDGQTPNGDFDDILNEANHITYYWPINNNNIRVKPVDYTANVTPKEKEVEPPGWTFENGCPPSEEPGGGGGEIGDTKDKMASAGQKVDSTENVLTLLIDGGNTLATQAEVDNSIPPETMQVYNDLMNKSPYLSDTVVSTAIEKEDVLPGAMIRDIMVANPKAAKSEQLMNKLAERWNPLPEYMKAQILAGRSIVSIREETESRLAVFKLEKMKHFNTLVRYYLTDTVNLSASFDSLAVLLQNENSLNAKYKLAMLKAKQEAWNEGLAVMNNIPVQFELTQTEAEAHSQITSYYTLLSGMAQQGKSVFEADSAQIAILIDMETSQSGKASIYARNILLALDQIEYEEPIILPDLLKSAEAMDEYNKLLSKANDAPGYIKVQPNPAKDYIIVKYELEQQANLTVEINDISGILKYSKNTTVKQDQHIVDTRNWNSGIYIVSLKINGKLIETVKFTVID